MKHKTKLAFFHLAKWSGLFLLSRLITRKELRILCYHAFETQDESAFRPRMFMKPATFARRMASLRQNGYSVLALDDALMRLRSDTLPGSSCVITIDDGFQSVHRHAVPVLVRYGLPATIYVTTYFVLKEAPVFRLVVQYMFWKTQCRELDLGSVPGMAQRVVDMTNAPERQAAVDALIRVGEALEQSERERISVILSTALNVDYEAVKRSHMLSLMTRAQIRDVVQRGFDVQLHTHRHRFPNSPEAAAKREITENRLVLEPLAGHRLSHFCYPSGEWCPQHLLWLQELGVVSATTCVSGLNARNTNPLLLNRFLDDESVAHIEFEAELSGFTALARGMARLVRKRGAIGQVVPGSTA